MFFHSAQYFRDIWSKRFFWMSLVKVDLRKRYRRSVLGIGWSLMHPVAMTIVFCIVFSQLFGQDIISYAPFVLSGLAFWSYFTGVLTESCQCYFAGEAYIRQSPAPLAIYPLRTTVGMAIHFAVALIVLLALVWMTSGFGNLLTLWTLIPTLVLFFALGWSVSIIFGVINVVFQDTQHLVQVGMQALFYMTPIFYPAKMLRDRGLGWIVDINPLAACLDLLRRPVLDGQLPTIAATSYACGFVLLMVTVASLTLAKVEKRLIFYL
ncbi:MAG: ABC transporter permease [Pirellulales bacterium]|nr:ABC transporter permease [Pirellulales bacterium]